MAMQDMINRMLRPIRNRVYTMITRAVIESVKDGDGMQLVKISLLAGEARSDVEHFQEYGFTSNPPDSSECDGGFRVGGLGHVGGNRDHLIVLAVGDRLTRLKGLEKGEAAMYNGVSGKKVHMKNSGELEATVGHEG